MPRKKRCRSPGQLHWDRSIRRPLCPAHAKNSKKHTRKARFCALFIYFRPHAYRRIAGKTPSRTVHFAHRKMIGKISLPIDRQNHTICPLLAICASCSFQRAKINCLIPSGGVAGSWAIKVSCPPPIPPPASFAGFQIRMPCATRPCSRHGFLRQPLCPGRVS